MKTILDTDNSEVIVEENGETHHFPIDTAEAFDVVARAYLRVGWEPSMYIVFHG